MKSPACPPIPVISRPYAEEADLRAMLDMLMQARQCTNDWHYAHVGELLFNFFMVACHLDPRQHIRLWQDMSGRLVGFAILGEDPNFDWCVLPEYEWSEIEEDAIAWVECQLESLKRQDPRRWSGELTSGSRQDDLRRISFLEMHGFCLVGRFAEVNMLRLLSLPIPVVDVPVGCRVSCMADLSDISDRAAAQRDVWLPWTVGNVSDADYADFMRLPGYHPDLDVVTLAPDGKIAAYVNSWIDPVNRIGDFGPVGTREEYRHKGYARLALLESLRRMRAYGMNRVCISTGVANRPALNLYSSLGFEIVNRYLDYNRPNSQRQDT